MQSAVIISFSLNNNKNHPLHYHIASHIWRRFLIRIFHTDAPALLKLASGGGAGVLVHGSLQCRAGLYPSPFLD